MADWIDELTGNDEPRQPLPAPVGLELEPVAEPYPEDPYPKIPAELKDLRRWVVWKLETRKGKDGKEERTKVPYDPKTHKRASSTKPSEWASYWAAVGVANQYDGIGFVFAPPYVGIDLDKCRNPESGEVEEWARQIIQELDSYSEISPSGTGVHIIVKGDLPPGRNRAGRVEMYSRARYFTMTGNRLKDVSPRIEERDLTSLHGRFETLDPPYAAKREVSRPAPTTHGGRSKFESLMAGDWKGLYQSQSEADQALCGMLAYRYECDPHKIEEEFGRSGLNRDKWKRPDYRASTIKGAISYAQSHPQNPEQAWRGTGKEPKKARLEMKCYSDIEETSIDWLWQDRIPRGKLTVFSGNPDVGKTTVTCDLIAKYTTGREWPDGSSNQTEPGEVLILTAEDGAEDTIKPRLLAAGADVRKVHHVMGVRTNPDDDTSVRMLALDTDMEALRHATQTNTNVGLIIIDPVTSYFGKADLNKEQEVRRVFGPLKELCEQAKVTIIALGHFNKRGDVAALHRVGGAVAMSGLPRAVWLFAKDPSKEGEYLMLLGKGNLSKNRDGLSYCFGDRPMSEVSSNKKLTGSVPVIKWQGTASGSADDVLGTANDPRERREAKARRFLEEYLADGEKTQQSVVESAKEHGISRTALFEVKKLMDIESRQKNGKWWWAFSVRAQSERDQDKTLWFCCGSRFALRLPNSPPALDRSSLRSDWNKSPAEDSFTDGRFGALVTESRHSLRSELAKLADDDDALHGWPQLAPQPPKN